MGECRLQLPTYLYGGSYRYLGTYAYVALSSLLKYSMSVVHLSTSVEI